MDEVVISTARWTASAHSSGEVLAAYVPGPGLGLAFLGAPVGFSRPEVESWLSELIGVAGDAERNPSRDAAVSPIPRLLHHALTGLLFYEAELWNEAEDRLPCAFAFVESEGRVAFGWTGTGRVELSKDGQPFEPVWVLVRDEHGRSARALVTEARHALAIRATWPATADDTGCATGTLEAVWPGSMGGEQATDVPPRGVEEPAPQVEPHAGASDLVPPSTETPGDRRRGAWRFRSWMDRLAGPRAPETAELPAPQMAPTQAVETSPPEPIAHDVPGVPDQIPEPPVASEPAGRDSVVAEMPVTEPDVVPESAAPGIAPAERPLLEPELVPEAPAPAATSAEMPLPEPEIAPGAPAPEVVPFEPRVAGPRPLVRRPAWPGPEEIAPASARPSWQHPWFLAILLVVLFGAGWLLGRVDVPGGSKGLPAMFKALGLGPASYELLVTSRPSGAWISVDGVDQARRTPAALQLKPGVHEIVLSISGVGGSAHTVRGRRGERVPLEVELWGSLKVTVPQGSPPIAVIVDGLPSGYAPVGVDRLSPGIHRLQFSGPGIAPWEQTVEVHVNRRADVVAQPVASPASGVLEVRATLADEWGAEPLAGAAVWIDGEERGTTPLKLELPRGPHSIRVRYRDEEAPVQVIELPGGNQRFATLELGLDSERPHLEAALPGGIPLDRPTALSASLDRVGEGDVREMWLHVRTPEGAWRRYPMAIMKASGGLVGVAAFPTVLFDARGRTAWYVSAVTPMGDEYFTEIQPAQSVAAR